MLINVGGGVNIRENYAHVILERPHAVSLTGIIQEAVIFGSIWDLKLPKSAKCLI